MVLPFALFLLFWGCSHPSLPPPSKPIILVPISPYAYFVEEIVGDLALIKTVVPLGANLHTYEPTPKEIKEISQAAIWFRCGAPFEQKLLPLLKGRGIKMTSLSEGISLMKENGCIGTSDPHDEERDLHVWLNPLLASIQAKKITEHLVSIFPEHRELFFERYKNLADRLQKLDYEVQTQLASAKGAYFLISHPALGYYCSRYGVHQIAIESEGKEPRMYEVAQIVEKVALHKVKMTLTEPQHNNKGALLISEKFKIPVYEIDPYAWDCFETISHLTELIAKHYGD